MMATWKTTISLKTLAQVNMMRLELFAPYASRYVQIRFYYSIFYLEHIKARSSAQHKEAFKAIQRHRSECPLQLLLDMKVHWSSMFVMLTRAESRQKVVVIFISLHKSFLLVMQAVDEFVYELGYKETNIEKRRKIDALTLKEGEWTRVRLFCNLLQVRPLQYV